MRFGQDYCSAPIECLERNCRRSRGDSYIIVYSSNVKEIFTGSCRKTLQTFGVTWQKFLSVLVYQRLWILASKGESAKAKVLGLLEVGLHFKNEVSIKLLPAELSLLYNSIFFQFGYIITFNRVFAFPKHGTYSPQIKLPISHQHQPCTHAKSIFFHAKRKPWTQRGTFPT
jgi:hypothetical protein